MLGYRYGGETASAGGLHRLLGGAGYGWSARVLRQRIPVLVMVAGSNGNGFVGGVELHLLDASGEIVVALVLQRVLDVAVLVVLDGVAHGGSIGLGRKKLSG